MAGKDNKRKGISPLAVGIASTAAVAAGVAAVALSKKENRKKAGKVLKDIKSKGEDLTKRASIGLDKVLKEQQKISEKAKKLNVKAKKVVNAKVKTKRKATTSSRSVNSKNSVQARTL